jgi:stage IV sporulation protein FB
MKQASLEVFGFPLRIDPSAIILIVLLFIIYGGNGSQGYGIALMALAVILTSVLVHELGHAFVARRMGLGPIRIVLHGFGGLTHFSKRPNNRQGVIVSLAGPVAGLTLGVVSWVLSDALVSNESHILTVIGFQFLIWINLFWSMFNLLPMYPLDGGQVLWHALAQKLPATKARKLTQQISIVTAIGVGVYALTQGFLFIALICLFTYSQNTRVHA